MATLGEYLRSHREEKGVSLEEIADATRINVSQLRAIEEENFSVLPGGVFTISFVRQYARAVGADEDQAASLLKARTPVTPELPYAGAAERTRDPLLARGPGGRISEEIGGFLNSHGSAIASVAVGMLLIVGGLYSYEAWDESRQDAATQEAAAEVPQPNQATSREPEPTPVVNKEPQAAIRLELEIVDTVWIRADADGSRVLEGVFRAGDHRPIRADKKVTMKVGNAGGVVLALNGEALPPLGPRGHVRSLEVTPDGMEIILPEPKPDAQRPPNAVRLPTTTAASRWADLAWSIPAPSGRSTSTRTDATR